MTEERSPSDISREQLREYRRIVSDAVAELRSAEVRTSYASLSLEELMDQHIARLQDSTDPVHPSRLQRLRRVRDELVDNLEAIKATMPESFRRPDPESDVNTEPEET